MARTDLRWWWAGLLVAGCPSPEDGPDDGVTEIDLVSSLSEDEARAGMVTDPTALPGGIGAEARPGDVMLRNDRVRFVLQATDRVSGGLYPHPGGVIDADLVRDDGTADADMVLEWLPALDVGWLPRASEIEVLDDGRASGTAVVRVTAEDEGFAYLDGVFEAAGRTTPRGVSMTTTYTLEAGTSLMRVETELVAHASAVQLRPGDILQAFKGIASPWIVGEGRGETLSGSEDAVMIVHNEHGTTLGMFADDVDGSAMPDGGLDLFSLLVSFTSLYEPAVDLVPGEPATWTRWYGVGASPAVLTDAWLAARGEAVDRVEATVTDGDQPVAGARVTVLVDGRPWTLALSDLQGRVGVDVPHGSSVTLVAEGAGSGIARPIPLGAGDPSPLADPALRAASLATIRDGAPSVPHPRGYGRAEGVPGDTLVLARPGTVRLRSEHAAHFEARLARVDADVPDDGYTWGPPEGRAAIGWATSGTLELAVPEGSYDLLVWAGTRHEVHREALDVVAGEALDVDLTGLRPIEVPPGWYLGDTHIHATPSFDGTMSPVDRALNVAGVGLDIWFASEHDVAVDHSDLVAALGLDDTVHVVGSVEVTPWVRGHVNLFPVQADPSERAGGAWAWWEDLPSTTTDQFDALFDHHGDVMVQLNHPFSPGLPSFAGWREGEIAKPDFWWDGFDAIEVIVPGQTPDGLRLYADLEARGIVSAATGSSDSHGPIVNDPGLLSTWFHVPDAASVADLTDAAIVGAVQRRATVATNGPMIVLDPPPGSVVAPGSTLSVTAYTPSWIPVDRVELMRDGVVVQTATAGPSGVPVTFTLDAVADASFLVVARGDSGMTAISGRPAWAVSSAVRVDVGGDGWTPPKPPLAMAP